MKRKAGNPLILNIDFGKYKKPYKFDLPETPNKHGKDIFVKSKCPRNAKNPKGRATFICKPTGAWEHKSNTCFEPPKGTCPKTGFKTDENSKQVVYLPEAKAGATKSKKCSFGKLTSGEIQFACEIDGGVARWKHVSGNCHPPPGSGCVAQKAKLQTPKGDLVFSLKDKKPGIHKFRCPKGYGGTAQFECTDNSEWTLVQDPYMCDGAFNNGAGMGGMGGMDLASMMGGMGGMGGGMGGMDMESMMAGMGGGMGDEDVDGEFFLSLGASTADAS